jgi:DnaJ-class molecular chaperone
MVNHPVCPQGAETNAPIDEVIKMPCEHCGGEGQLYTSRYGGNDPDVWPVGECPTCEGTGYALYETEPVEEEEIMR